MKKMLAAFGVAGLAVVGLAAPAQAAPPPSAAMNHESYWEDQGYGDCTKVEFWYDGVTSYTLPELPDGQMYTLLVLKAASGEGANDLVLWPAPGTYMHSSDKDLSHIIYCVDEKLS